MSADIIWGIDFINKRRLTTDESLERAWAENRAALEEVPSVSCEPHLHLVDEKIVYMSPPYVAPPTDCA